MSNVEFVIAQFSNCFNQRTQRILAIRATRVVTMRVLPFLCEPMSCQGVAQDFFYAAGRKLLFKDVSFQSSSRCSIVGVITPFTHGELI